MSNVHEHNHCDNLIRWNFKLSSIGNKWFLYSFGWNQTIATTYRQLVVVDFGVSLTQSGWFHSRYIFHLNDALRIVVLFEITKKNSQLNADEMMLNHKISLDE